MPPYTVDSTRTRLEAKVTRLRNDIAESDIEFTAREDMYNMLDAAIRAPRHALDKAEDTRQAAVGEALMEISLMMVEDRVHKPSAKDSIIRAAVRECRLECPLKTEGMPRYYFWFMAGRWPATVIISVGLISGNMPAILDAIRLLWLVT